MRTSEFPLVTASGVDYNDTVVANVDGVSSQVTVKELIDALNGFEYFADTGGDDAYGITSGLSLSALIAGMHFVLKPTTANTGACTLTVDSVTAKDIKVVDGSGVRDPLTGEVAAGMCAQLIYNGTYFILCNPVQVLFANASYSTPTRIKDTEYQNTAYTPIFIIAQFTLTGNGADDVQMSVNVGASSPPTTQIIDYNNTDTGKKVFIVSFIVPPRNYYKFVTTQTGGTLTLDYVNILS